MIASVRWKLSSSSSGMNSWASSMAWRNVLSVGCVVFRISSTSSGFRRETALAVLVGIALRLSRALLSIVVQLALISWIVAKLLGGEVLEKYAAEDGADCSAASGIEGLEIVLQETWLPATSSSASVGEDLEVVLQESWLPARSRSASVGEDLEVVFRPDSFSCAEAGCQTAPAS